jgi:RimJ/RimL family protein N-acetyltransferase
VLPPDLEIDTIDVLHRARRRESARAIAPAACYDSGVKWETRAFDPEAASRAEWEALHALEEARFGEMEEPPRAQAREEREASMRTRFPTFSRSSELAVVDGRPVGRLVLFRYTSGERVTAHGALLRAFRRRGIARVWLGAVLRAARAAGAESVGSHSFEADGRAFLERHGFVAGTRHGTSRLEFAEVDRAFVDSWIGALADRTPLLRLEIHRDRVPEDLLEDYVRLTVGLGATVPGADSARDPEGEPDRVRERLRRLRDRGGLHDLVVARAPDGAVAGFTEITLRDAADATAAQGLTGVLPERRGRGLANALKAAMVRHLAEARPGVTAIETTNADGNAPIVAINTALGFRRRGELVEYEIATADLAARFATGEAQLPRALE